MRAKPADKPTLPLEQIREVVGLMRETGVLELALDFPDFKVSIKRAAGAEPPAAAPPALAAEAEPAPSVTPAGSLVTVTAQVVGIFTASGAGQGTAISPGDWVQAGHYLGGIEAMNITNEVRAPVAGRVAEIMVEDGAPVQYGQTLFIIEAAGGAGNA